MVLEAINMNFKDIPLKYSYESGRDDLLWDFYIPVLSYAKRYDRIAGFFSSASLAVAARGMAGFIFNGGTMRLLTCQRLSKEDADIITKAGTTSTSFFVESLLLSIDQITDAFMRDHLSALGWMLTQGRLQIRIVLVSDDKGSLEIEVSKKAIMHQKVGLFYDEACNGISFSGSNNESASGWLDNVEEFKVFKAWEAGQNNYYLDDQTKFEQFWANTRKGVLVVDLPTAIRDRLIEVGNNFELDKISLEKYYKRHAEPRAKKREELKLFFYQKNAVDQWATSEHRLLLEMATGCGKTRTAIGCLKQAITQAVRPLLIIIACPQTTLSQQWKDDIDSLSTGVAANVICDGTVPNWQIQTSVAINKLSTGLYSNLIVYTTHATCSSEKFIALIEHLPIKVLTFFIGDEVHGLGAPKTRKGLLNRYEFRLGLSATPSRWFDEDGSRLISDYFDNNCFQFSIHDALITINPLTGKPFLVNFNYHPHFVQLTEAELEEYKMLSEKITKMSRVVSEDGRKPSLEFLLFKRANLEKNAENKYSMLEEILEALGVGISNTIIFVSDEQIDRVLNILGRRNISAHRFTQSESTTPSPKYGGVSERQFIIKKFITGDYQALVAIKCLDEGIDIPSANRAIVMASSTNPREYIQRIGRIIRQAKGKFSADIHDLILHPDISENQDGELAKLEKKIFSKEMERVKELSINALNNAEILNCVYRVMEGLL